MRKHEHFHRTAAQAGRHFRRRQVDLLSMGYDALQAAIEERPGEKNGSQS